MFIRSGVHKEMEDVANAILRSHLSGITKHSDKSDILTPWKEQARRSREVYVTSGTPDPALRRGVFIRSMNSAAHHLNSVEAMTPPKRANIRTSWDSE